MLSCPRVCLACLQAVPGEESNLIYMPAWKKGDMDDDLLPRLVDLLLRYRVRMTKGDVREYTPEISEALAASQEGPVLPAKPPRPQL